MHRAVLWRRARGVRLLRRLPAPQSAEQSGKRSRRGGGGGGGGGGGVGSAPAVVALATGPSKWEKVPKVRFPSKLQLLTAFLCVKHG